MGNTIFMIHGMWGGGWYWDNKDYIETEKSFHLLPNDTRLECVKMYKKLKPL